MGAMEKKDKELLTYLGIGGLALLMVRKTVPEEE